MFIGRERELQVLQDTYNEKKGQLIVLYGRRRVGKTETLREFCKDKPHVFFSCTQTPDRVQLSKFSKQLLREDIPARQYVSEFADWEKAFLSILDLPYGESKKLLIIDEFPYMCKGNKSIPSILQNLWVTFFKDRNVMIILCGSAMSFIEKELLAEKNPLYGRATGIYKMNRMGFYDAIRFFPNYSDRDKVLAFMKDKTLISDTDTYDTVGMGEDDIEAARVVKHAAASENKNTSILTIKVAGEKNGERCPLDAETETQLAAYIAEIKDAGVRVELVNIDADTFNCEVDIYYDPMLLPEQVENACREAIKEYIENLPFNGEYTNMALVDRLQMVEGVKIPELRSASTSANGEATAVPIDARYVPQAGYFMVGSLTINMFPY